ncbi:MAG: hypothetical protein QOD74_814 [Variibacter sp.]|nr:hypothetical protein [Variibacter sp.]
MALEQIKEAALPRALTHVVADLADLLQKEVRLAKAELSANVSAKVRAGVWMSVAALFGVFVLLLLVQALVFWIASRGFSLHAASLMTAVGFGVLALLAFMKGRADAGRDLAPTRTIQQVRQDISTVKDRLS